MRVWGGIVMVAALTFFSDASLTDVIAQPNPSTTTIKGVLTSIKGDAYLLQDLSGRFVQFRVDKNTQRERLVVPGERIEVQLSSDHRALTIKPVR